MLVKLPNGLVDGMDHFNMVELDELRGKQQNYLADKELVVNNIGHVPKILEDMVLSLQTESGLKWQGKISEAIWKLPSGDLETILVKIRENTYGPRFYHQGECTHCKHVNKNLRLNLDELEITYMPLSELMKPKVLVLPKSNLEMELKPIFLKDLLGMVKLSTGKQDELITSVIAIVVKRLGTNSKVTAKDINQLSMKDINYIQEQLEVITLEGKIDTDIEIECQGCHQDFTIKLNTFDPSFFVHSKGSLNSNT